MNQYDVIIIGGGASGMLAAISASQLGKKVLIIEQNEKLGKKLFITGKGRCNITNSSDISEHLKNVNNGQKFMYSAYHFFDNNALIELLNDNGLQTTIERGNRVFPTSNKSSDVIKILEKIMKKNNVKVILNTKVNYFELGNKYNIIYTNNNKYTTSSIIIATGGLSYSSTGSTGDGYKFAKNLDIKIVDTKPALVPILLKESTKELEGLSLKNVKIIIEKDKKQLFSSTGEMLFTSRGVSGPIVLSASSQINKFDIKNAKFIIDTKPALSMEKLTDRIDRETNDSAINKKSYYNYLKSLLPASLLQYFVNITKIDDKKRICDLTKNEKNIIINCLKNLTFNIERLDNIDFGIITSGGISTDEINPKTMQSKKYKNLYFAGEVLDIDANTGGYNLQIAFSTGFVAGYFAGINS